LGVPFFAIKHELVVPDDGAAIKKGTLGKAELKELQRRMLQTLEDLFGD
jgi:hypothetical protein